MGLFSRIKRLTTAGTNQADKSTQVAYPQTGELTYCIDCNEAMLVKDFQLDDRIQPLGFCVNDDCPRFGLASLRMSRTRVVRAAPKPKQQTKAKRASPSGSAGISKEGDI